MTDINNPIALKYNKILAIIVPYRDRADHLKQFLPHMITYFQRDKLDKYIQYSIHVIEQLGNKPFNVGKLRNVGFMITQTEADYFCFHDVDYLPIWADYSYCDKPVRLIWHGLVLREDYENFFSAVLMFNKADFLKVNGYSNDYWGWGPEGRDLAIRCQIVSLDFDKRDGTFMSLPHNHRGFKADRTWTDEAIETHRLFQEKIKNIHREYLKDGLNTLKFEKIDTKNISISGKVINNVYHHKVKI
jgi:predicted glycosyltransferase involved in capsule biosynthesis